MSRILITGAGGGIARAIIPVLHELGHSLLLTTRSTTQELTTYLEEQGIKAAVKSADLTNKQHVEALFTWVQSLGGLDVLVNNAGIAHAAASWKLSAEEMEQLFQVNFFSAVRCSSRALPLMRAQEGGRIINISSVVAHKPSFGTSGYAAAKSALEGYARGIAVDVANKDITANTIAYGYMQAGMLYDVPEPMLEEIKKTIPAGRFGDATQIGHTINFLINSPFTTGQTIHLNGGQWMP
jgi:3-oxoacyl-[acyl-carrier protein] reductase|tara:strand:+ start:247 stop:963 length:717 start_codon:yes stop_codon:yes gene_type:complete